MLQLQTNNIGSDNKISDRTSTPKTNNEQPNVHLFPMFKLWEDTNDKQRRVRRLRKECHHDISFRIPELIIGNHHPNAKSALCTTSEERAQEIIHEETLRVAKRHYTDVLIVCMKCPVCTRLSSETLQKDLQDLGFTRKQIIFLLETQRELKPQEGR